MSEGESETMDYLRAAAALLALGVSAERRPEIDASLVRIAAFARDIAAFPLAATVEPSTRFEP